MNEYVTLHDLSSFGHDGCFTESFRLALKSESGLCMLVTALARFEGNDAPGIRFFLIEEGKEETPLYESHRYRIGKKGERTRQCWRVPPMFHPSLHAEIALDIPEGTRLFLDAFSNAYADPGRIAETGFHFNAHLGFSGVAPANTLPAIELAAQCGFATCIVTPKEIGDGTLVCIHDSTITRHARTEEGVEPADERRIYEMTLEEMRRWDYGRKKSMLFRHTPIPLVEDFFKICAKTGMKPMFSTHTNAMRETGWQQVKKLLRKYGLTPYLHVKSGNITVLEAAYDVFGDAIDGYTLDNLGPEVLAASRVGQSKKRLGVEWQARYHTKESVQAIRDAGYFAAAYALKRGPIEEYEKLIEWGVTEFTEDHHCSMGLNW